MSIMAVPRASRRRRAGALAAALIPFVLVGCATSPSSPGSAAPGGSSSQPSTAASEAPAQSAAAPAQVGEGEEITIDAFDLYFEPRTVDVAAPGQHTVRFTNDGAVVHDITFEGGTAQTADPGEMIMFEVAIPEGGTTFLYSVSGHAAHGMTGTVTVAGEGPSAGAGDDHAGHTTALLNLEIGRV